MKWKIRDDFFVGMAIAVVVFFMLYSLLCAVLGAPFFSSSHDMLWIYLLSAIPDFILFRFMLVRWDMRKTGEGMAFVTLLGVIVIMFIVR